MGFPKNMLAGLLGALGPWAPFWIALTDSSFLPLAQVVDFMIVAQAVASPQQAYATAGMAVAGSTLGCFAAYLASCRGGRRILDRFVNPERSQRLQQSFEQQGVWPLIVQTMLPLPLPMRLWVIGAGVFGMQPLRFLGAVLFARVVRYFGLAFVTLTFGERVVLMLKERAWVCGGLLLAAGLAWLAWKATASQRAMYSARAADRQRLPERSARLSHEQSRQKLAETHARHSRNDGAALAGDPHGDRRALVAESPAACSSDSGTPLQPGLHLLQRV
ncbi:MAG: VTT domain-containing protein [Bryobacterales bacterium]